MVLNEKSSLETYLSEISKYPLLSPEEELDVARKNKNGCKLSRAKLINSNLRYVVSIAKKYQSLSHNFDLLDIIESGNLGLIKAVDRFNPENGNKFTTYAKWWITQVILKDLKTLSKDMYFPLNVLNKIQLCLDYMDYKYSLEEACDLIDLKPDIFRRVENLGWMVSLNAPLTEEEETSFIDVIVDKQANTEYQAICIIEEENLLELLNEILSERDRDIFLRRLKKKVEMVDGKSLHTLQIIGEDYGISRERVRQIESKAIKTIKAAQKKKARDFKTRNWK